MKIPASSVHAITLKVTFSKDETWLFNVCVWYDNSSKSWRHNLHDNCHDYGFGFLEQSLYGTTHALIINLIDDGFFDDYKNSPVIVEEICKSDFHNKGRSPLETYEVFFDPDTKKHTLKLIPGCFNSHEQTVLQKTR